MTGDICVIGGCGHVGLPLALSFASKKKHVHIFDNNENAIHSLKKGEMPFYEKGGEKLLQTVLKTDHLHFTTSPKIISKCRYVIFILGTPVDRYLNPRFNDVRQIITNHIAHFRDEQIFILRSTVYPGVSQKISDLFKTENKNVHVAFCPERIAQGNAIDELKELPQIISAFTDKGLREATKLFSLLTDKTIPLQPLEAELVKLFNNVWRYISFAIANQFFMIANDYGLDFYRIHRAMTNDYPRAKDFPTAGFAAGPCLFKDTMQLAAFNNNNFFLGHSAMLINEGLPNYIVHSLKNKYDLKVMKVGILGMAFKPDSDDKRDSLAYKLRKILELEAGKVLCSDVHIHDSDFVEIDVLIEGSNIIILACPHREYKGLSFGNKHVVDIWNFFNRGGTVL